MKINYEIEDLCVGCPQGCVHCGRDKTIIPLSITCDNCNEDHEEIYRTPDGDYCKDCLTEVFQKISVDDIAEDVTAYEDELWVEV